MPGWKWIHTPGHTEGHISLFHEKDRVLIAADAFSTTKQESLLSVMTHAEQISGPPKFPSGLMVNGNCDRTAGEITPIVERNRLYSYKYRFNPLILEPVSQNRLIS